MLLRAKGQQHAVITVTTTCHLIACQVSACVRKKSPSSLLSMCSVLDDEALDDHAEEARLEHVEGVEGLEARLDAGAGSEDAQEAAALDAVQQAAEDEQQHGM